jgi:hypothetical protein
MPPDEQKYSKKFKLDKNVKDFDKSKKIQNSIYILCAIKLN